MVVASEIVVLRLNLRVTPGNRHTDAQTFSLLLSLSFSLSLSLTHSHSLTPSVCLSVCLSVSHTHARARARTHTHTHNQESRQARTAHARMHTLNHSLTHIRTCAQACKRASTRARARVLARARTHTLSHFKSLPLLFCLPAGLPVRPSADLYLTEYVLSVFSSSQLSSTHTHTLFSKTQTLQPLRRLPHLTIPALYIFLCLYSFLVPALSLSLLLNCLASFRISAPLASLPALSVTVMLARSSRLLLLPFHSLFLDRVLIRHSYLRRVVRSRL